MEGLVSSTIEAAALRPKIGILIADPVRRRLAETAAVHMELFPHDLSQDDFHTLTLSQFEMILADEPRAGELRAIIAQQEAQGDGSKPALVVVTENQRDNHDRILNEYDGILSLSQDPASIVAQLGLVLYAHRTFARRYQSALEELHLNRRIFRSVTSGITVANAQRPDLPLVYVNPAFEFMTGYSLEEVLGRNCRFLQGEETDQPAVTLLREAIASGHEVVAVLRNFRRDGTPFWNELSLSPIRSRDGILTHIVGIQQDVTARVEFEAALRESEKLAAVGRLAASIAHEINNPLESVMNLIYLARNPGRPEDTETYLAQADHELQRVAQITQQSLRFYKQSTMPHAVQCSSLIAAVLDVYRGRLENASVHVLLRERMQESIICLESEIRQVLSNLVRNAIDAMHGKGGRLLVRTREATDWTTGRRGAMLTLADTGSGISKATMTQLFTAFFTTKGIGGTGLGLWVSAEIVERHQGRLRVRSNDTPGCSGTIFQLFLPLQSFPT